MASTLTHRLMMQRAVPQPNLYGLRLERQRQRSIFFGHA